MLKHGGRCLLRQKKKKLRACTYLQKCLSLENVELEDNMGPVNEQICFASKLNYVQFDFPFALKLLSCSLPLWNLHKLSVYILCYICVIHLLHLVTEQLSTSQSISSL